MFDEIKAKLGLDITDFERKLVRTQGSLRDVTEGAAKKFTDLKQVGATLATALGLNIEKISEGIARMIVGFSKEQEDALNRMVDAAKNAANQLGGILSKRQGADDPQKRIELLDKELESVRLQAQARTKLTYFERLAIAAKEGPFKADSKIKAAEEEMAANREAAQIRIGQISRERLIAEDELKKKNAEKEKKSIEEIGKNFKAAADEREKRSFDELSTTDKIKQRKQELIQAEKDYNNAQKTGVERSAAKASAEKLRTEIKNLETQQTNEIKDAEKNLTKTRRQGAMIVASDAKKLELLKGDILDAEKELAAAGDDQLKKKQAENKLQEAKNALLSEAKRISDEATTAEQKKTDEIAKDLADLTDKADKLKKDLAESKRKAELPTMAEVASGQRDIGVRSREDAKKLEAEEAKIKKLSDNETRLKGQLEQAKTAGDRKNLIEEGRRNRAQLDAARARRDALLGGLAGKISDVPFAEQEKAAKEARDAAAKAQAEANKPKPAEAKPVIPPAAPELKPEAKPIVSPAVPEPKPAEAKPIVPPVSAAEAAATAAQNAVQTAQLKLTSTTGRGVGDMSGISSDLSSCVRILGDIKDRLESTSISTT